MPATPTFTALNRGAWRAEAAPDPNYRAGMAGHIGALDIITNALWIAAIIAGVVILYRGMQRPRLALTDTPDGWRATPRNAILYALSVVPLILVWWTVLAVILLLSSSAMSPARMLIVCGGVIVAVRILAHLWEEPSHELSKTIPLTLLTLILISGTLRDPTTFPELWDEMLQVDVSWQSFAVVVLADVLITVAWYWIGVRVLSPRGVQVPGVP